METTMKPNITISGIFIERISKGYMSIQEFEDTYTQSNTLSIICMTRMHTLKHCFEILARDDIYYTFGIENRIKFKNSPFSIPYLIAHPYNKGDMIRCNIEGIKDFIYIECNTIDRMRKFLID